MSQTDHGHDHAHDHATIEQAAHPGYYEMLETAVRELLVEKKLIAADEIRRQIEVLDSRRPRSAPRSSPAPGSIRTFVQGLLADGRAACEECGISFYDDTSLIVVENTDKVHNLIVCTLCSCYPRPVLGPSARLVQAQALPGAGRLGPPRGACRVRHDHPGRCRGPRPAIPQRWSDTSCCRCGRKAQKITPKSNWRRLSRATR